MRKAPCLIWPHIVRAATSVSTGLYVGTGVEVGSKITVGGKDMLVSQSNHTESNTAFQQGSIQARYGDEDTVIHALSSIQG